MAANRVQVGPWGGKDGVNPWTFITPDDSRISQILIHSGSCVDSIRFTYIDHDKVEHHSETFGGDGGSPHMIAFADDEYLNEISGTVGVFNCVTVITSLSFQTNKKNHGPYGSGYGTSFSLPVPKARFVGFLGNYGEYLDSIGFFLQDY